MGRKPNYKDEEGLKAFGKRLRELRLEKGVTQESLAYSTDLALSQIGRIERGEIGASISFVFLFASTLGVEPKDFFDFKKESVQK
ncbi:XRE family transcriptional regulator [Flavipsychrobacter stenotrophus]|uniref:XRE family transcriptional regulator n=1 Tax=Flavipsychrobacter stenotrophus TaxID=2077091 RepID=A0A2S7SRQ5_9BACT|nr:helix-turn-helix transcriptional regulator [Flavipsychrobacter stenotrophus]PQJ09593.1 XRE family transcriptional regulator [Flavipsychrobacter stenotrophus]